MQRSDNLTSGLRIPRFGSGAKEQELASRGEGRKRRVNRGSGQMASKLEGSGSGGKDDARGSGSGAVGSGKVSPAKSGNDAKGKGDGNLGGSEAGWELLFDFKRPYLHKRDTPLREHGYVQSHGQNPDPDTVRTKKWEDGEFLYINKRRFVYYFLDGEMIFVQPGGKHTAVTQLVRGKHFVTAPETWRFDFRD